jgi:hypothetical protein
MSTITSGFQLGEWATDGHFVIIFTGSTAQSYTLPDASHLHVYTFKLQGTGAVTIHAAGTQTIDAATTTSLSSQFAKVTLMSDGKNWNIVA